MLAAVLSAPDDRFLPRVPLECECEWETDGDTAAVDEASDVGGGGAGFNDEALLPGPSLGVLDPTPECDVGETMKSPDDALDEDRDRALPPAVDAVAAAMSSAPPDLLNPVKKPRALAPVNATPLVVLVAGDDSMDASVLPGAFRNELPADPDTDPKPESAPDIPDRPPEPEPRRAFVSLNDPEADRPTVVALPRPRMLDGVP